jgi:16S rRNA (guanine527-N7)-methyltransferase
VDAISARALADLATLLDWTEGLRASGAVPWLHKGENFAEERALAAQTWTLDLVEHPSRFGPGVIVEVRSAERRS